MQLKASTDYGIRAILYLAAENDVRSSKEIAREMSIPRDYLIQLAQLLRNAGLIEARPGKHGGYLLARKASEISLLDIINAMELNVKIKSCPENLNECEHDPEVCNQFYPEEDIAGGSDEAKKACQVRRSYSLIQDSFNAYLDSITIDFLLDCADGKNCSSEFLSQRLKEESARLMELVA
ncbi:MAG: Rrf2 family transcriptional regulator [Raoultibacter sp.]